MWSWILTIVGLTGFVLAGRKVWWCWYLNLAAQILWFSYGFATHQYGFIVSALVYTVVFAKNARDWTREHKNKTQIHFNHNHFDPIGKIVEMRQDDKGLYVKGLLSPRAVAYPCTYHKNRESVKRIHLSNSRHVDVCGACRIFFEENLGSDHGLKKLAGGPALTEEQKFGNTNTFNPGIEGRA